MIGFYRVTSADERRWGRTTIVRLGKTINLVWTPIIGVLWTKGRI